MKKIVSVFLCFLLFVGTVPLFSISSLAASYPTGYPNTHINTGDEIIDVVEIAKTQLGYKENSSGGSKYGAWRGNVNGGWCNFFVQWCLNEAGIGEKRFPYNNSSGYLNNSDSYSQRYGIQYHSDTKNYTPKKGDICFFAYSTSTAASSLAHVGLVYSTNSDSTINIIEGNCSDKVQMLNKVKVKNLANKQVMEFTIVGESEADFKAGKLAATTPIARALMGHSKGETVEAKVPSGIIKFEILDITL